MRLALLLEDGGEFIYKLYIKLWFFIKNLRPKAINLNLRPASPHLNKEIKKKYLFFSKIWYIFSIRTMNELISLDILILEWK